jgi:hypothetical protein
MSILSMWKASPELLASKTTKQIITIAGDGRLTEDGETSKEFRSLLSEVPSEMLAKFALNCLEEAFPESGLALQDVVNEMGRRLGLTVLSGRYRGKQGVVGNDGLWTLPSGHQVVVEVKTTDAYRINLEVIAGYRTKMIRQGDMKEEASSGLIVVGRNDTDDLEAQIRGSRHAWSMRLLSVESLIRLVSLKESLEDPSSLRRIHQILVPREFTKLDAIVDLVFSTAEDVKAPEATDGPATIIAVESVVAKAVDTGASSRLSPVAFNDACAEVVGAKLGQRLIKRSRATYSTSDDFVRVVCAVSKTYDDSKRNYWFAFHLHQRDALLAASLGYVAFGCGSPRTTLLIPAGTFNEWLDGMNTTAKEDRVYWHVQIFEEDAGLTLIRKKGQPKINMESYRI